MRRIGDPWTMERKEEIYAQPYDDKGFPRDRIMMAARFVVGGGDSVLDLACGAGQLANIIDDRRYLGVDHSPAQLQRSREGCKNPNATFIRADVTNLPASIGMLGQFDFVVCCDILEHLDDPHALAQVALSYAKRRVIITLPVSMGGYDHTWRDFTKEDVEGIFGKPALLLEKYRAAPSLGSVRWIGVWRV